MQLHILNSHGRLDVLYGRIAEVFSNAIQRIQLDLPALTLDVVVSCEPQRTIPELGICGYCPSAELVNIYLDPAHPVLNADFEVEFTSMLGHEMHHAARWSSPGYGRTLLEALVSEGLACSYEGELCSGRTPCHATALSSQALQQVRNAALQSLDDIGYDHSAWFFGSSSLPRHAGYAIGFELISRYIQAQGRPASSLCQTSAEEFRSWLTPP